MATPNSNSPDVLSVEILAEARRECDEIIRRAQRESESLLAAATTEADKIRREKLDFTQAEVARRTELMLATIPVEAGRLRSKRIEAILGNILEEACHQLQERSFDGHKTVVALAADAVRRMPGTDFVLKISAADHAAFGDKLAEEIKQHAGRSPLNLVISADPAMTDGGVMVQDAEGLQIWDNQLLSRLERLWPELRRQIATRTSLVSQSELPEASMIPEWHIVAEERTEARQRLGVRQPAGAFTPPANAAEGWRSSKPGGSSDATRKGDS